MRHRNVAYWPLTTDRGLSSDGRFRSEADKYKHRPWQFRSRMTQMYGPAVRCTSLR